MIERVIKYAIPLLVFLLPGCSQEEEPGAALRPMEFSVSISDPPHSRVSETADGMGSTWTDGDKINVKVVQGGKTYDIVCTLDGYGNITKYSDQPYWNSKDSAKVTAWYSANTGNFADQTEGLPILLWTEMTATYSKSPIQLTFRHKFAKVRVRVEGEKANIVNSVKVNNYTSYSLTNTTGTIVKGQEGYINMRKNGEYFEANVLPVNTIPNDFIYFGDDFKMQVSVLHKLEAGKVYTITMDAIDPFNDHPAVLMREASGTPGSADYLPALYFADRNIGASTPQDAGLYFWWGDVVCTNNAAYNFSSSNSDIKTNGMDVATLQREGYISDGKAYDDYSTQNKNLDHAQLKEDKDAAHVNWGGKWHIPTYEELYWFYQNCSWEWDDNKRGYSVTSNTTQNSIFLPAAGECKSGDLIEYGTYGYYFSSTPEKGSEHAGTLYIGYDTKYSNPYIHRMTGSLRYNGQSIRPVVTLF